MTTLAPGVSPAGTAGGNPSAIANPTATTLPNPTAGLWRAVGDSGNGGFTIFNTATKQSTQINPDTFKAQYGIDFNSLPSYVPSDVYQAQGIYNTGYGWVKDTSGWNLSTPAQNTPLAVNTTAPTLASPTQLSAAAAATTQQLAPDQGKNIQTTTDQNGNIVSESAKPLAAAQTATVAPATQQNPAATTAPVGTTAQQSGQAPVGQQTPQQIAATVAATGQQPVAQTAPVAPVASGTSTGAAGIDANYQMQPGESIDAYNARIASYNATKPITAPSGAAGSTTNGTGADPYVNLDPVAKQVAMYQEAYKALGLSTIKDQYDSYVQQQKDLQDTINEQKQENQNNPWLSQAIVERKNANLDTKYKSQLDTLTNLLTLTDSLYKQGTAQVDTMVSAANADIKATNDLAQKQIDAANALAKDNVIDSVDGREVLVNKSTGKIVADLGATKITSTGLGDYSDTKTQNALEQQYRTALEKELSNRSGGLGLQDAKVNQAIHLKALFNQYKDANGNYNIPQAQYAEVAMGLANLVSGTNQVSDSAREAILQRTAAGDFKGAITYITGTPQNGNTQAVFKNLVDSIDRQGQVAQELRDQYIGFLHGLAPTGLDPSRISALEATGLASYTNPTGAGPSGSFNPTSAQQKYNY